jgi:hypothetical protein
MIGSAPAGLEIVSGERIGRDPRLMTAAELNQLGHSSNSVLAASIAAAGRLLRCANVSLPLAPFGRSAWASIRSPAAPQRQNRKLPCGNALPRRDPSERLPYPPPHNGDRTTFGRPADKLKGDLWRCLLRQACSSGSVVTATN